MPTFSLPVTPPLLADTASTLTGMLLYRPKGIHEINEINKQHERFYKYYYIKIIRLFRIFRSLRVCPTDPHLR